MTDSLMLASAALSAGACVAAGTAHIRFRRLRKACALLQGDSEKTSFMVAMARKTSEVERLRAEINRVHAEFATFRTAVDESIRRVAVLRYDAFQGMGGQQSWSVAMLDENGDGLVLTSLAARSETRTYVKSMDRGVADRQLSPEEIQVVKAALEPTRTPARVPAGRKSEPAAPAAHAALGEKAPTAKAS